MPVFLHVGCGKKRKASTTAGFAAPEWRELRLDIDPAVRPDIVASMTEMSEVADGSMDGLFSSHNIEHLYPFETAKALAEFRRVLKPGGFAVITCPDLKSIAGLIMQDLVTEPAYRSPAGPISALDMLYGHQSDLARGNLHMAHRSGFTNRSLEAALRAAGFTNVVMLQKPSRFELWALAVNGPASRTELRSLVEAHFPLSQPLGANWAGPS